MNHRAEHRLGQAVLVAYSTEFDKLDTAGHLLNLGLLVMLRRLHLDIADPGPEHLVGKGPVEPVEHRLVRAEVGIERAVTHPGLAGMPNVGLHIGTAK